MPHLLTTNVRGTRNDSWYNTKGRVRKLIIEMENMKRIAEEREEYIYEEALQEGVTTARALNIKGYKVEVQGKEWYLTKKIELKIDKTIKKRIVVKLEEWMQMTIPIEILIEVDNSEGTNYIVGTTIRRQDGTPIRLFHTNNETTCWGEENASRKKLTKENLDKRVEQFKTVMEVINHGSMYAVSDELTSTKNLISKKYGRYEDTRTRNIMRRGTPEQIREHKRQKEGMIKELEKKVRKENPYIPKEKEVKTND